MAYTTIDDPSAHFQVDKYTADTTSDTVTFDGNSNLKPDLIWVKSIDTAYNAQFHDSSRGATAGAIYTNLSDAEDSTYHVDNFLTDGYINDSVNTAIHANGETIMSYGWKANGGTTTSATTTGGIASATRQVDTTSKFAIIGYTSASSQAAGTIEHGLGVAPEFMIVKRRPQTDNWAVYHHKNTSAPETELLSLNTNNATTDHAGPWNDTAPTSSVFTLGALSDVNEGSGVTYIAYLWAGVQGYSKFGHFTGNGVINGQFVYTGFKPAWILIKEANSTTSWGYWDHKRILYNPNNSVLLANTAAVPYTGSSYAVDFLSNGFKMRTNDGAWNGSDDTYIYAAWAEEPLVTSGGVPATAR